MRRVFGWSGPVMISPRRQPPPGRLARRWPPRRRRPRLWPVRPHLSRRRRLHSPERVTGEGHAMGTHLAFAAFTTPEDRPREDSRGLRRGHERDRPDREAHDDVGSQRARSRPSMPRPARRRSSSVSRDLRRHPARLSTPARSATGASTSRSRRCTASGSSTRTSIRTRRHAADVQRAPQVRRLQARQARRHRSDGLPRRAARPHLARRHRQGLRRRPGVEGACSTPG